MVEVDASEYKLGLAGKHQMMNAVLAKNICSKWMNSMTRDIISDNQSFEKSVCEGLLNTRWPGRSQIYFSERFSNFEWALDGAHTSDSMSACISWYRSLLDTKKFYYPNLFFIIRPKKNILIFNVTKGRDGLALLQKLVEVHISVPFSEVVFCANESYKFHDTLEMVDLMSKPDSHISNLIEFQTFWFRLTNMDSKVCGSVEECVSNLDQEVESKILVTGSLHLVGNVLKYLDAPVI